MATMLSLTPGETVRVLYTNWRAVIRERTLRIESYPFWAATEWHPQAQWLVWAADMARYDEAPRAFALADMAPVP